MPHQAAPELASYFGRSKGFRKLDSRSGVSETLTNENSEDGKLRVCHLVQDISYGGVETLLSDLITQTDDTLEHHVVYVSEHDEGAGEVQNSGATVSKIDIPYDSPRAAFDPRSVRPLHRYLRQHEIDVLHTHYPLYPHIIGRLAALFGGVDQVVGTYHNQATDFHPVIRGAEWATRPLADRLTGVGKRTSEQFSTPYDDLLPGSVQIETVHDGIDTEAFNERVDASDGDAERDRWDIDQNALLYLCVGRYSVQKAQLDQIQAMKYLVERKPSAQLMLVGHGPHRSKFESAVDKLGLESNVTITGGIPHEQIHRCYAAADVFTLSSTSEGFGIALLEAMAATLPIVATNIGGPREVVHDGTTGYLVSSNDPRAFADAMHKFDDSEKRAAFGKRGYQRVSEEYDISSIADEYKRLYTN